MGLFYAAQEQGIDPFVAHRTLETDRVLEDHYRKQAHTKLMTSVYKIMDFSGRGHTKTARHIRALSSVDRETTDYSKKASDIVFDTVRRHEGLEKLAGWSGVGNLVGGAAGPVLQAALLTALVGSAAIGAGAGGLYHMGKRDITEDEAKNEAKKRRIKYYKELTDDLESRFEREGLG